MKINEVKYFHPKGKTMPNGSHYTRGGFLHECYLNANAFIHNEGVHSEQHGPAKYRGGVIVLSTEINATESDSHQLVDDIKQIIDTFGQRLSCNKRTRWTFFWHGRDNKESISEYSVGNFFRGGYIDDKGKKYNEKSICLEVKGVSTKTLFKLSEMICEELKQETVLVKDLNTNKIFTADTTPMPSDSSLKKETEGNNTEM